MKSSMMLFLILGFLFASTNAYPCQFLKTWSGRWFQSGVPHLVEINSTSIETKGTCVENEGDKFLIEDRSESCYRCVVIHEKHENVLQYKETYCFRRDNLDRMCSQIAGDATLYSMFRSEAGPTACPFRAPYTFTYNRGSGECGSPVSRVDSCTDESRLLLRYQACPDVHGTESAVEELVCIASWKDGSTKYLVGKLHHTMAHTDEDRYRCFVYQRASRERRGDKFDVAQSGDATCNGLLSATEGSRTMRFTKVDLHGKQCRFPVWVTDHHEWHTLDHQKTYHFSKHNASLRVVEDGNSAGSHGSGRKEHGKSGPTSASRLAASVEKRRMTCHSTHASTPNQEMIVAHDTKGCESGFICMAFYKREGHVIELQQSSKWSRNPEEACSPRNFNPATLPYITLITAKPRPRPCPYLGRYTLTGLVGGQHPRPVASKSSSNIGSNGNAEPENTEPECSDHPMQFQSLAVGCTQSNIMQFHSACNLAEPVLTYSCHGTWEDNGTSYLIASPTSRKSGGAHRYCFIYTTTDMSASPGGDGGGGGDLLQVASVAESCRRNINSVTAAEWAFNLTATGQCAESSFAAGLSVSLFPTIVSLGTIFIMLNSR